MIIRAPRRRLYRGLGYESCDPRDSACVQRVTGQEAGDVQQNAINQTDAARDRCHSNANLSNEPFRSQLNAQCDASYPAGAATGGESVQYWQSVATKPALADEYATEAQSAAEYNAGQVAAAAQLRAELARVGQTFIPDAARVPTSTSVIPPIKGTPVLPGGSPVVIQSSGAQNAPGGVMDIFGTSADGSGSGFSFSSIPVLGWVAIVGVGIYAMGGKR